MVATGLALPYVVLSFFPAWLSFLPKPGAWMAQFKAAMGFPMLATALWLFTVAMDHFGKQVLWLGVFLILVALAAWFFGEFYQRRQDHPRWALALVLVLLFVGYGYALEYGLDWRHPTPVLSSGLHQGGPEGIAWQPWTPQAVAQARRDGQVVLVDFTADWCLTCRVNAKTSLEIPAVRAKLKALNVVTLRGDYTRKDDTLTAELRKFKRAGVPLVLVYPRQSTAAPLVLPEILTPKLVLEALDRAAQ
jgi:thiol:disulfide interchange protein DsbD